MTNASWHCCYSDCNGACNGFVSRMILQLQLFQLCSAWSQSLLEPHRRKMYKGLGFSTGFVALCAFVS